MMARERALLVDNSCENLQRAVTPAYPSAVRTSNRGSSGCTRGPIVTAYRTVATAFPAAMPAASYAGDGTQQGSTVSITLN